MHAFQLMTFPCTLLRRTSRLRDGGSTVCRLQETPTTTRSLLSGKDATRATHATPTGGSKPLKAGRLEILRVQNQLTASTITTATGTIATAFNWAACSDWKRPTGKCGGRNTDKNRDSDNISLLNMDVMDVNALLLTVNQYTSFVGCFYVASLIYRTIMFVHCCYDMRSFGLRTVDKVGNATGILGYSVGFVVDSKGGRGLSGPPEYITVPATQDRLVVSIPQTSIKDGDVIVFWFSVSDMVGNKDDVRLTVGLDRTAPKITADEFKKKTVDDFTSRYLYRLFKVLTMNARFLKIA